MLVSRKLFLDSCRVKKEPGQDAEQIKNAPSYICMRLGASRNFCRVIFVHERFENENTKRGIYRKVADDELKFFEKFANFGLNGTLSIMTPLFSKKVNTKSQRNRQLKLSE